MPKINLLPKNVSELIAAGEVVERPASVIKELVENSIDAGATVITVEINRGGITYIRVTDNGCGIAFEDVPTAFLRHATSKITKGTDLDAIGTLGFRGEALAAVSSVARVEMLTATADSQFGAHYKIEGGEEVLYEESGCPQGTTIIIRDIFYNTPARMKFLKKDISEANACAAVIDRIALSHPEISFKFIRDGKQTLSTTGDKSVKGVVYSVLGREFSSSLIEVESANLGITVNGLTCKPVSCRPTRNNQFTFLNGRLVRSGTVVAAVEQAYKNSAMVGKFPGFVLYINIPFDMVDVNVHPAKTEVRFSDEKLVFDSVYSAIKNAINKGDTRPEIKVSTPVFNPFQSVTAAQYKQAVIKEKTIAEEVYSKNVSLHNTLRDVATPDFINKYSVVMPDGRESKPIEHKAVEKCVDILPEKEEISVDIICEDREPIVVIGQVFDTYIVAQMGESVYMIDKHAAHERILFNSLKKNSEISVQPLLTPLTVSLSAEEYDALICNLTLLEKSGFEVEDFGNSTVLVRAIPSFLTSEDVSSVISEIAENIFKTGLVSTTREDDLFHTIACKAAIKAGSKTSLIEMQELAEKVLYSKEIMYCPHGRPVAFEIKKRELEKQFGRIQ
ncbi:MAG: DNA mismatch repair endonuclease MutL [Clostridia bacterium]|nr:DNA mismatch repair endonuclease MutL [Clostridia bacterium]